jgi:DEAD/DEAH box helicase domain-containing protein
MRKIVIDIETSNQFREVGSTDPAALNLSIICVYDYETDTYSSYLQEELKNLWPLIEKTDMIITFNGDHFDIPLLNKYYSGDLSKIKSLDLMKEIKKSLGRRIGLGAIAQATLGKGKGGSGLEAITWWKNGEVEKVKKYCLEDVKVTKELYEFALKNKKVMYSQTGQPRSKILDIPLDTKGWEDNKNSGMTFTLPF